VYKGPAMISFPTNDAKTIGHLYAKQKKSRHRLYILTTINSK
jgi:hypothetical protein